MWDMRCEIVDFALCHEPFALRILTPDPPPAERLKPILWIGDMKVRRELNGWKSEGN